MPVIDEESFRALLDARGILRPDAGLAPPPPDAAFTVFAQRPDARIDVNEWRTHAERFVATRLGLTVDKRYDEAGFPAIDAVRVALAHGAESGVRFAYGRPRTEADATAAEDAERRTGAAGLGALARRCGTVWLVATDGEDDRLALRLAAILAGVLLGPILAPGGAEIFGPKTARLRLETR